MSQKTFLEITGSALSVTPDLVVEKKKEAGRNQPVRITKTFKKTELNIS